MSHLKFILFVLLCSLGLKSYARPEYAAAIGIVNCAVCHVNPYGGGARNVSGKLYGSRDYKPNWFSKQELLSVDVRGQEYWVSRNSPKNTQSKGLMLMNAIPTANLPITPDLAEPPVGRLVLSYNFAPVGAAFREGYYLIPLSPVGENSWLSNVLVGNFAAPFGLLTDEHRTYTHQMVAMTNRDFESGVMLTGDPTLRVHYDLAATSGFANGGLGTDTHPNSWAGFANVRHQVPSLPLQFGLSYALEGTTASAYNLEAECFYAVLALDRLTGPAFQGSFEAEAVWARGWNNSSWNTAAGDGIGYFIPTTTPAWQTAVVDSRSSGYNTLLNWDLNRHWTLQLKYEQFTPDVSYAGDSFYRTGEGFKYFFNSNASLMFRHDDGYAKRPGLTSADLATIGAVGETYLAMLHIWL